MKKLTMTDILSLGKLGLNPKDLGLLLNFQRNNVVTAGMINSQAFWAWLRKG